MKSFDDMKSRFRKLSRSGSRVKGTLGIISLDSESHANVYRSKNLNRLDSYYDNVQYDHLPSWDQSAQPNGQFLPVRQRKPKIRIPFAKTLAQRLASKLIGASVFPEFKVTDQPEDTAFVQAIVRESSLRTALVEPVRRMLNSGSVFVRFWIVAGVYKVQWYSAKFCYPTFQENGEIELVSIKYIYEDKDDKDKDGNPKKKWYRLDLGMDSEVLFDNPEYEEDKEPTFTEVERVEHGLGFVQGEWCMVGDTSGEDECIDGYGITSDIMDFIDELNYSLSQSSHAVGYNQDPQLAINGMDEEELDTLIRSAAKSWNLGRNGKAEFLEGDLSGVKVAMELRDKVRLNIQDIARVLLLDPEKIVGSAQSAKAMEVLYGPMKDLIDELRPLLEKVMKKLIIKMSLATLVANRQGIDIPLMIPPAYVPQSMDITADWPPIFQQTMEDLQKKVSVAGSAKAQGLIAPATAVRYIAKDFGIEDIEAELVAISEAQAAAAALNPFGGF